MSNSVRGSFNKYLLFAAFLILLQVSFLDAQNKQKKQSIKFENTPGSVQKSKTADRFTAELASTMTIVYGDTVAGYLTDTDQRSRLYPDPGTWGNTGRAADVFHFTGEIGDTVVISIDSRETDPDVFLFRSGSDTEVGHIKEYDYGTLTYVLEATSYDIEVVSRYAGDGINLDYAFPYVLKVVRVGGPVEHVSEINLGTRVYAAITTYDDRSQEENTINKSYRYSFADFYRFSGSAGDTIIIQTYNPSETFEPAYKITPLDGGGIGSVYMDEALYNALRASTELIYDNSENPYTYHYSWSVFQLTGDGEYLLEMRSEGNYEFGPYVMALDIAGVPPNTNYISHGGEADQGLSSSDRTGGRGNYSDYYDFYAEAGDSVLIELTSDEFDTFLFLYGPDDNEKANTEDQPGSRYSWIGQRIQEAGLYTIEVTSYNSLTTGSYDLSLNFITEAAALNPEDDGGGSGDDISEPNDIWTDAYGPLVSGQTIEAYIGSSDDVDWFYFTIDRSRQVTIDLNSLPGDYDMKLWDEYSEDPLAVSEFPDQSDESIVMNDLAPATYWIVIYPYNTYSESDSYELTLYLDEPYTPPVDGGDDDETVYVKKFEGTWDVGSSWGIMTLYADGNELSGNYVHDSGRIEAELSHDGINMNGTWSESPSYEPPNDAGLMNFYLWSDEKTFSGYWQYGDVVPNNYLEAARLDFYLNGYVYDSYGEALEGVSVRVTGGDVDTVLSSGSSGYYHLSFLSNGSYAVSYEKSGYDFEGSDLTAEISDGNYSLSDVSAREGSSGDGEDGAVYVKKFEGTWEGGGFDTMVLLADGTALKGDYTHDSGRIEALLTDDGMTLSGSWLEYPSYQPPEDGGLLNFSLSDDGMTFFGYWQYGDAEPDMYFSVTRVDYYIGGYVRNEEGEALEGVSIKIAGGSLDTTLATGPCGYYQLSFLQNGIYSISYEKSGYDFSEFNMDVEVSGANSALSDVTPGGGGGSERVGCDFNGDGNINISDVISLLLFQRANPGDLRADFTGDGNANIADAISMLLAQRGGNCPDALVSLAGALDGGYLEPEPAQSLSLAEVEYIEKLIDLLNLTSEEKAAFYRTLHGSTAPAVLPEAFSLGRNVPNPFNPSTSISYSIPENGSIHVTLSVYDLRGKLVTSLVNEVKDAGVYQVFWNGRNDTGRELPSGVYFYRLQAGEFSQVRKMVLLK